MKRNSWILCVLFVLAACRRSPDAGPPPAAVAPPAVPSISFEHIRSYPHDTNAFTEGLFVHDSQLYESTGATRELPQTRSLFGIVDLSSGTIDVKAELDREKYFGEGIAFLHGKIYQLTYTTRVGFVYDAQTYRKVGEFSLPGKEGWGLTTDGTHLILSDGSDVLTWLNPTTYQVEKTIRVTENGYAKDLLNELEYIGGFIFANVWTTHTIVKINPSDGKVAGILDLSALADDARRTYPGSLEMNGIAWDSLDNTLYVTGKMWPKIYTLRLVR